MTRSYTLRKAVNTVMLGSTFVAAFVSLIPLFLILFHLIGKGAHAINWDLFTQLPVPVGEMGGGMANGMLGSLLLIGIACLIGLPIGILGGIYLAEFGGQRLAALLRFTADILNGTPSIVIGLFAYTLIVLPMKGFSALAGGVALGIMMIPTIMRTTEEMLRLVPTALREGAYALGIPYWRTMVSVVLKTARSGIITGILLSVARISGETAPLLFTALGNQFWSTSLGEPIAALPLQIFTYATSPFESWQSQAWAGALTLITMILLFNIGARLFIRQRWKAKRS